MILENADKLIYLRGCLNPYPGYDVGECWENEIAGYGKSKICFCGEDECNGFGINNTKTNEASLCSVIA